MKRKSLPVILAAILATTTLASANPIPIPPPASMPLEQMYVEIQRDGDDLHAVFTGDFTFTYIPNDVNSMLFPVPPDANNIGVWQDNVELAWTWSSEEYPTILPEMPTIPMIEWQGPFPTNGAVFAVDYEHDLIKRPKEFIFFYALGTGKYFPTYEKTTTAHFDILLPVGFAVGGVWLDDIPHEYEVTNGHLMLTVESWFGPITNDLIVSLAPTTIYVATNGNDVTGDGSTENPFRTIQKGIDTAADGCTVIVQPGLYEENINFLGKNITLTSTNPMDEGIVDSTIIDGNDVNSVVIFSGTESSDCVLRGFTITNGEAPAGGGIYGNGTLATIENNIIIGNHAVGYGIPGSYGWGGGLLDCDGLIQNNIITDNHGGFGGGAAGCDGRIRNNIISYNGWYAGGGMDFCDGEISNNLLVGNRAIYGGALSSCNGIIRNCNVVGNWATYGSGLRACNGSISNCIIWKNGAGKWTQIEDCSTPIYSCIEDWTGAGIGNTSADPCFANIGYWQLVDEGSWYWWDWVDTDGDYHLKSRAGRWDPAGQNWVQDTATSPCIDGGDPNSDWTAELWPHGKRINMGAYGGTAQASMSTSTIGNRADLNNDDSINFEDFVELANSWQTEEVLLREDFDRNGVVGFNDLKILADNWLICELPTDER